MSADIVLREQCSFRFTNEVRWYLLHVVFFVVSFCPLRNFGWGKWPSRITRNRDYERCKGPRNLRGYLWLFRAGWDATRIGGKSGRNSAVSINMKEKQLRPSKTFVLLLKVMRRDRCTVQRKQRFSGERSIECLGSERYNTHYRWKENNVSHLIVVL